MSSDTEAEKTSDRYQKALHAEIRRDAKYPVGRFSGKGIVIVAGGRTYLTGAWASISILRRLGVSLPVQLWFFGDEECDDRMQALFSTLDVECVNARDILKKYPSPRLERPLRHGNRFLLFELKCYAILHARFEEVLFLDADNVPLADPTMLFDEPEYRKTGSLFWPDPAYGAHPPDASAWAACGLPPQKGPAFETGQLVINKRTCWHPLQITWWMNEESAYWFRLVHGDKDTYKLVWHTMHLSYALAPMPVSTFRGVLQHAPDGRPMFFHRWFIKPTMHDTRLGCLRGDSFIKHSYAAAITSLRSQWNGRLWQEERIPDAPPPGTYRLLLGKESRTIVLRENGIVLSPHLEECLWHMGRTPQGPRLVIQGREHVLCFLEKKGTEWRGTHARTYETAVLRPEQSHALASTSAWLGATHERCVLQCKHLVRSIIRIVELAGISLLGAHIAAMMRGAFRALGDMPLRGFLFSSGVTYVGTAVSVLCMAAFYGVSLRIGTEAFGALHATMALAFLLFAGRAAVGSFIVMHAAGDEALLGSVVRHGTRLALLLGFAIAGLFLLAAPVLREFLHLGSLLPFVLIGCAAIPCMLSAVVEGILNVQKRFAALTLSSATVPAANLLLAFFLFRNGFQDTDAGWIVLGSQLLSCVNIVLMDRSFLRSPVRPFGHASSLREVGTLLAASILFGVALRMDVFWARHVLSEAAAGSYAVAASIALVLYLVTNGIARVSSVSLRAGAGTRVVALSYAIICGISLLLAAAFASIGAALLTALVGRAVAVDWQVLLPLFIALTCYAIITFDYVCLNVVTKRVHAGIGIVLVLTQGVALVLFGSNAVSIARTQGLVFASLTILFSVSLILALRRRSMPPLPHPAEPHLAHQG